MNFFNFLPTNFKTVLDWFRKKRKLIQIIGSFFTLLIFLFLGQLIVKSSFLSSTSFKNFKKILGFRELLPTPAPYPVYQKISELPSLSARSIMALDVNSMVVLYEKEPNLKLLPASTTKIMTALVALDYYPLDIVLTVGKLNVEGNLIKLIEGEKITVENLLYGLLVGSGNDAAFVLADNFPGGRKAFVEAMNQKAKNLGLANTHFTNPAGLDEEGHYSTARDLAQLTVVAVKNPVFSRIVSTSAVVISDVSGEVNHFLKNTNELVGKLEGVKGVKTGWTQNAGECLIALTERGGEKIITVVLGSKNRFEETQQLIEWIFTNFKWETISSLDSNYSSSQISLTAGT